MHNGVCDLACEAVEVSVLNLLQEGREQQGSWRENLSQAQVKLSCSLCGEICGVGKDVLTMTEEWAARVACVAQVGVVDCCKGIWQQPKAGDVGDRVNEPKDVVWELAVVFNSQFH